VTRTFLEVGFQSDGLLERKQAAAGNVQHQVIMWPPRCLAPLSHHILDQDSTNEVQKRVLSQSRRVRRIARGAGRETNLVGNKLNSPEQPGDELSNALHFLVIHLHLDCHQSICFL
jgi:hypothetical protein